MFKLPPGTVICKAVLKKRSKQEPVLTRDFAWFGHTLTVCRSYRISDSKGRNLDNVEYYELMDELKLLDMSKPATIKKVRKDIGPIIDEGFNIENGVACRSSYEEKDIAIMEKIYEKYRNIYDGYIIPRRVKWCGEKSDFTPEMLVFDPGDKLIELGCDLMSMWKIGPKGKIYKRSVGTGNWYIYKGKHAPKSPFLST